uniref:hypothetical protein n=1 Tax=Micromonospora sp. NBC_00855 TaxID=2975978 RepID=UPI002252AB4C
MVKAGQQSARRLANAEVRRAEALEMFLAGKTYQVIAEELDYADRSSAWRSVQAALAEHAEHHKELAAHALPVVLARLERLWEPQYEAAQAGDTKAAALCLQMLDRYSKLHGLDRIQVDHTVTTRTELDAEIETLVARLAAATTPTPTTEGRTP